MVLSRVELWWCADVKDSEAWLPIGLLVKVVVVVDGGIVKVTSTVPIKVCVVDELNHAVSDPEAAPELLLCVPVTRGIVVKLKEGNGVKIGTVKVVALWVSGPVSVGVDVSLNDGNGALVDTVLFIAERVMTDATRVLVKGACVTPVPVRLFAVGPTIEVAFVCGKGGVLEVLTDVLTATVAEEVDVE